MTRPAAQMQPDAFHYAGFDVDPVAGVVACKYAVGGYEFEELVHVEGGDWDAPGVEAAAQLVFLLGGVSYYKAFAPLVIDLGVQEVTAGVRAFLREFYQRGLGEFAYRNELDLRELQVVGGREVVAHAQVEPKPSTRPLVPFGGGMDSIVSVETIKRATHDANLFIVSRSGDRFDAIEQAAAVTGLAIQRASRDLDPRILQSRELGFLNGHVPVTGILSAIAVLAAVLTGRDAVIMSNEWSASVGNFERHGEVVNHQYSKSLEFERSFRDVVGAAMGSSPQYFSLLRPFSELWVARRFAEYPHYQAAFRSCNRAFHIDRAQRLDRWCGQCDKCAFIDLILSPFLTERQLADVFESEEPLADPALVELFRTLIGTSADSKPFECVGDVGECRAAVLLASERIDRRGSVVLEKLKSELEGSVSDIHRSVGPLLDPIGDHFIPEPYASAAGLE